MREILFRGKRTDNGVWVEGYLIHDEFCNTHIPYIGYLTIDGCNVASVIPKTVGQYTGLTDKNGKKIFEGDILHFKTYQGGGFACPVGTNVYHRVLFGKCNPDMNTLTEYVGFWAIGQSYDEDDLYEYGTSVSYLVNSHGACVIGNIHDNPELLKEGVKNA